MPDIFSNMSKKIKNFFRNQVNKVNEGRLPLLVRVRNLLLLLIVPFLLLVVLFIRLLRPFVLIRFGELISSKIGHLGANTEVYLCERDLGMQGPRSLDIFYINGFICNRQLMKMWKRVLPVSVFAPGLDWVNRALPGGDKHKIQWREHTQDRDIFCTMEHTKAHISFLAEEERLGELLLQKLGIKNGSPFICFLSRDPAYLDAVVPKINTRYHDHRDSDIKNFIPAVERLTANGYSALRMGAIVKEPLEIINPMIIDYAIEYRTEFLDIFLGAKCRFYLGDPCGFHAIPMIFRRPLAIANFIPLEYAPTWSAQYLFIPKKLWLRGERRFLTFGQILGSKIGRCYYNQQYEKEEIEVIENTPEEITALAIEMDQRLKGEWQINGDDDELQKRFWGLFKPGELNRVFRSRIGAEFLRQNTNLLKI